MPSESQVCLPALTEHQQLHDIGTCICLPRLFVAWPMMPLLMWFVKWTLPLLTLHGEGDNTVSVFTCRMGHLVQADVCTAHHTVHACIAQLLCRHAHQLFSIQSKT